MFAKEVQDLEAAIAMLRVYTEAVTTGLIKADTSLFKIHCLRMEIAQNKLQLAISTQIGNIFENASNRKISYQEGIQMIYFIIAATVFNGFWGIVWSNKNLPNVLFKMVFIALAVWGVILTVQYHT